MNSRHIAIGLSLCCSALFLSMVLIGIAMDVNPQEPEHVAELQAYSAQFLSGATAYRYIFTVDAVFIAAYFGSTYCLLDTLSNGRWRPIHWILITLAAVVAILDYHENFQLLAWLNLLELGQSLSYSELADRDTLSSLKWILGHATFFFLARLLDWHVKTNRIFIVSLVLWQLPIGTAALILPSGSMLEIVQHIRSLNLALGFIWIAWIVSQLNQPVSRNALSPFPLPKKRGNSPQDRAF